MTPAELASRHEHLFHLTAPEAVNGILRNGLRPPLDLLDLFEAADDVRARVLARRPTRETLSHPTHGRVTITDNRPLSDRWLERVLLGGLTPDDWRRMLAERVFFWPTAADLKGLAGAALNRGRARAALRLDTRSLAEAHGDRMEISPINSGATRQSVPPRGLSTYAPLLTTDWQEWRSRRRKAAPDVIREVTIRGPVLDIADHVVEVITSDRLPSVT